MLINTERDYNRSRDIVEKTMKRIQEQEKALLASGKPREKVKRLIDPQRLFIEDIAWEVKWYERAKKGVIPPVDSLEDVGRALIALRIARGMTQTDLAEKLGISQAQISQDEDNEYHAISVDRAQKILSVFGAELHGKIIVKHGRRKAA